MNTVKVIGLVLGLCLLPAHLTAASFDGTTPLLCAVIDVFECGSGAECQRSSIETAHVPQFVKIDLSQKTISDVADSRKEVLKNIEHLDGHMIMQGVGSGRGWSVVIDEESGKLSAAVADDQVAFTIFGACTPL